MKVAFLDRDGTINRDYPDADWSYIETPELLEGSVTGMKYLLDKGYEIIIITNQYIIGEGYISMAQYRQFSNRLEEMLKSHDVAILDTFFCPHARWEGCDCCKPNTGLFRKALEKYPRIDLTASFFCGDSVNDLRCAKKLGLPFYGISIGPHSLGSLADIRNFIA